MKYSENEIKDAIRALKASIVYRYEPAEVTLEVALGCMQYCLDIQAVNTVIPIPQDVIAQARKQGYDEGWREGTEALIKLWGKNDENSEKQN